MSMVHARMAQYCMCPSAKRWRFIATFIDEWILMNKEITAILSKFAIYVWWYTVSETLHLCWNNETIRFKSSLTSIISIIIESTYVYLTLNMNKNLGCFKVQVGWKNAFYGKTGSRKGLGETLTIKKNINFFFYYTLASADGIFMYMTISKFKQVLRSRKSLDYNTDRGWKQINTGM